MGPFEHNRLRYLVDDGMLRLSLVVQKFGREFHRGVADALSELAPVTIRL